MKTVITIVCCCMIMASSEATEPLPSPAVTLEDFKLVGELHGDRAAFTLTATARVEDSKGGSLDLLSGPVALTEITTHPRWRVRAQQNRFIVAFDHRGKYPLQLKFDAAVRHNDTWNTVDFRVAPSSLQPILLKGLAAETQFDFAGAARPERKGSDFVSYLPSDGTVKLSWKETRPEAEVKLFYAAEMLSQISVSPGLMRQVALLDFKVMQGELSQVTLLLRGAGEVTRVQGDQVLAWNVEPVVAPTGVEVRDLRTNGLLSPALSSKGGEGAETTIAREASVISTAVSPVHPKEGSNDRRLVVRFNQPQKNQFAIQVQLQTPLGAFPQAADALQVRPEAATRFAGYFRIVNEGAVRLEVVQAAGLSQISPE